MRLGKRIILLVEDETLLREALKEWLEDDGYNVEVAQSGEEALEKIKREEYSFVVLDLRLPGIDGLQAFEEAKDIKPETKGLIITAYPSEETQQRARDIGLIDYLPKPFQIDDLEKIISGALEELDKKEAQGKDIWLELGAVSFRICTRNYECGHCAFAQDIQDRFGTIAVIGEREVEKFKRLPGNQRLCRYTSVHFVKKEKAELKSKKRAKTRG
ncbi:MAG: response regulator [Dehalococcoidia bacterium]|nr:response regulator [Dehalococcoidia bacterium]